MPDYTDFESFARDLYLLSSYTQISIDHREADDLDPPAFLKRAEWVVDYFANGHSSKIDRSLKKSLQNKKVIRTDEEFMRFVIPKCLNLIDDGRYFYSLMLVASYIVELTMKLNEDEKCYRFLLTGHKCLTAVFKRKFERDFESHGGFKGLYKYFGSVFKVIKNRKKDYQLMTLLNGCDKDLVRRVADLIRNCDDGSDGYDFLLTDYELSVAEDVEATKNEWYKPSVEIDAPLEFEWGLMYKGSATKVKSVYDKGEEMLKSARVGAENPVEDEGSKACKSFIPPPAKSEWSDSDVETSGDSDSDSDSKLNMDGLFDSLAFSCFSHMKPDEFNQVMSSRLCRFCGSYCYQYALHTFRKHVSLAAKERRPKWLTAARNIVGKVKGLVRRTTYR